MHEFWLSDGTHEVAIGVVQPCRAAGCQVVSALDDRLAARSGNGASEAHTQQSL